MTQPFASEHPASEQLSAYLDGELSGHELREIESLLASDAAARHHLAELSRGQTLVRSLPTHKLSAQFTAGVLARIAQVPAPAANASTTPATASPVRRSAPAATTQVSSRWLIASLGTVAAVVLLAFGVQFLGSGVQTPVSPLANQEIPGEAPTDVATPRELSVDQQLTAAMLTAIDQPEEVAVLRVKLPAGSSASQPVDQWLEDQQMHVVNPSHVSPTTVAVGSAYRASAAPAIASGTPAKAAGEAVYVELPAEMVEAALASLAAQVGSEGSVRFESELAIDASLATMQFEQAEGEAGTTKRPGGSSADIPAGPHAQRINPRILRLPTVDEAAPVATSATELPAAKVRTIRVLILVEDTFVAPQP
jgi:negative regulator of sigma E activity